MGEGKRLRVALLCGGRSAEREVSLAGAAGVEAALDPARYEVRRYDPATDLARLVAEAPDLDVAFILLHGRYGEDGTIQGLLDLLDLPYQGAGVLGSALAMDKHVTKLLYEQAGIPTPRWVLLRRGRPCDLAAVLEGLGLPLMVKPATQGSSVGMAKVTEPEGLGPALEAAWEWDEKVIAEAFVPGREITGGVLGLDELEALPLVEIVPGEGYAFFDYEAKYRPGATRETCPADLPEETAEHARAVALAAHRALQLRGYSRTDMMLSERGEIFAIETNTIPGMTPTSLFPQAAAAAGLPFPRLLDRLIELALEARGRT
ncbi:D-alanine--D-alanine ligase [Dissulfurirhabdus thermomarina]|uniref:D-alanine--D-alanine ligase n=1 Tax=Dissulfurirhabdus thermomarina TaxID=1765737 RepID=A0A6N9TT83_DISTH|nr:D-alanine--D-alanine ligase [Dissulfurirhabdus thermomarina]NDY42657.1 D-alanine--D-alanine ligase [Dissulfurirhabdus thermomarina]NMX23448.1 D-alanine--D-alanine ligase [Dissulfurirhabdus thermomarina]